MADFKTHVTFSSALGVGYAFAGMTAGFDSTTSLVAGGLCGLSGMLPDVDSDSGIPRRETMGFAAAIVPMLLVDRFREMGFGYDEMVLATAGLYFGIRFGLSKVIGKFSVHRGMWHSIPAALIFAGLAFLITGSDNVNIKYFKAIAVFAGTMSHLILDEVYSVDTRGMIPKFKKSFGTAVKLWGKNGWANFSTYAKLGVVALAVFGDMSTLRNWRDNSARVAGDKMEDWGDRVRSFQWGNQPTSGQQTQPPQQQARQPIQPTWTPPPTTGGFAPNTGGRWQQQPPAYNYAPNQQPVYPQQNQGWNGQPRQ